MNLIERETSLNTSLSRFNITPESTFNRAHHRRHDDDDHDDRWGSGGRARVVGMWRGIYSQLSGSIASWVGEEGAALEISMGDVAVPLDRCWHGITGHGITQNCLPPGVELTA